MWRYIRRFSQSLVSRFLSGMGVKVDRPDRVTRVELVRRLARERGLELTGAGEDSIAGRCTGSIREIEGAITRLGAGALRVDVSVATHVLVDVTGYFTAGAPA